MKRMSVRLDGHILAHLDRLGQQIESTCSDMIRDAIRFYVSRMERQVDEHRERNIFRKKRNQLEKEAIALVREQASCS